MLPIVKLPFGFHVNRTKGTTRCVTLYYPAFQRLSFWGIVLTVAASAVSSAEVNKSPKESLSGSASHLTHSLSLPQHAPPRPLITAHGSPTPHPIPQPTLAPSLPRLHGPYAPPPNYHHLYSGKVKSAETLE